MNYMEKVSKQFPKVTFMHATGYKTGPNFGIYNARFYEGRYLNGVIAGKMTKSNILGYVAAFPIPEVLQGINAFTLGARSVNPKAEVRVIWVNSWYDPGKEREAAQYAAFRRAPTSSPTTPTRPAVVQAAEEKGKYAFGYHSDMSKYGPKAQLTVHDAPVGRLLHQGYERCARRHLEADQRLGWHEGRHDQARAARARRSRRTSRRWWQSSRVRSRPARCIRSPVRIKDQDGKDDASPAGKSMSDDELGKMDYLRRGRREQAAEEVTRHQRSALWSEHRPQETSGARERRKPAGAWV